jgi:hypothetical protein
MVTEMNNIRFRVNDIIDQVIAEGPQIESTEERIETAIDYINNLTNVELLSLIERIYE